MIKEFVKAWDKYNKDLLDKFIKEPPSGYEEIVKDLVNVVINPYLTDSKNREEIKYPLSEGLDVKRMTTIDDGDYQGTTIYVVPCDTSQPGECEYYVTNNYYGSCSGCDAFLSISDTYWSDGEKSEKDKLDEAKGYHELALHLLQRFHNLAPIPDVGLFFDNLEFIRTQLVILLGNEEDPKKKVRIEYTLNYIEDLRKEAGL